MNENINLPQFTITMLGVSGVGKTIFMACMYVALTARNDLSIEAEPDLDRKLRQAYRKILDGDLPEGTVDIESFYDFHLLVDNKRIAKINWIDYRGGALDDDVTEKDAAYLHQRISQSDAVLMMLDLSSEKIKDMDVGGAMAQDYLRISRMKILINTRNESNRIKSVVFVRTKSDMVSNNDGSPNLELALKELVAQLNTTTRFINVPICAAIPVSSCKVVQNDKNEKIILPRDPLNTEWVLFIALRDLIENLTVSVENNVISLKEELKLKEEEKVNIKKERITLGESLRFWVDSEREKETLLAQEASEFAAKIEFELAHLGKLKAVLEKINNSIPANQVRIFINSQDN